jgi:phosphohistidine phosphatase
MTRELLILRHAKSDWGDPHRPDHQRPLNTRGKHDAPRIGAWMSAQKLQPDYILCSTATRARQTLARVLENLPGHTDEISYDERAYLAELDSLLDLLSEIPPAYQRVMLVGHNPGLDQLVSYISRSAPPLTDSGKLMTTAALAQLRLPDDWSALRAQGELLALVRPRNLA